MSKNLREIIFKNKTEVQSLVNEYKNIENEIVGKLNEVGKALANETPNMNTELEISKSGVFNWEDARVYKFSISKGENKIWIQYVKREINLYSNYYFQNGTDAKFKEIAENTPELNNNIEVDYKKNKNELIKLFINQVELINGIFEEYDKFINE
jgi:hypothetical protein